MSEKYNIKIESGADFVLKFLWKDEEGDPYDLTGATVEAQLREYPEATDFYDFSCTHGDTDGYITIIMPHETTSQIPFTAGVYDVFVTLAGGTRKRARHGDVKIQDYITKPLDGTGLFMVGIEKYEDLPHPGSISRLYFCYEDRKIYRWNGTNYIATAVGNGIQRIEMTEDGRYRIVFDDGTYYEFLTMYYRTPEDFGAVGDGVTDDTVAIQNCLDYCGTRGLEVRLIRTYRITSPLILRFHGTDQYTIRGCSEIHRGGGVGVSPRIFAEECNAFENEVYAAAESVAQIQMYNVVIVFQTKTDPETYDYSSVDYSVMKIKGHACVFKDCFFNGFTHFLHGHLTFVSVIDNCTFKNLHGSAFYTTTFLDTSSGGVYDSIVTNNFISHSSGGKNYDAVFETESNAALGQDSVFTNNFVEYFAYLSKRQEETGSMRAEFGNNLGMMTGNTFQCMVSVSAPNTVTSGVFVNNTFMNAPWSSGNTAIWQGYEGKNMGPFSIVTLQDELDGSGDYSVVSPKKMYRNCVIENNTFTACDMCVYIVATLGDQIDGNYEYSNLVEGRSKYFSVEPFVFRGNIVFRRNSQDLPYIKQKIVLKTQVNRTKENDKNYDNILDRIQIDPRVFEWRDDTIDEHPIIGSLDDNPLNDYYEYYNGDIAICADGIYESLNGSWHKIFDENFVTKKAFGHVVTFDDGVDAPVIDMSISIVPAQAGSGEPSSDNVRAISGWTGCNLTANGSTYPISWQSIAGTVYGGELDIYTGVLTVDRALIDLGSLTWTLAETQIEGKKRYCAVLSGVELPSARSEFSEKMICDSYVTDTITQTFRALHSCIGLATAPDGTGNNLYIYDESYAEEEDATAFNTAISGVMCVYPLATPITYQLTTGTSLSTVAGSNSFSLDTGDVLEMTYWTKQTMPDYIARQIAVNNRTQQSLISDVELAMVATKDYDSGDLIIQGDRLLRATGAIITGSAITVGTNAEEVDLNTVIKEKAEKIATFPMVNNAPAHNSIYRGAELGSVVTNAQWAAIAAGTFEDMYIGDYWEINSVKWRIAAFDYWYGLGDTACDTHHVVIVPDTNIGGSGAKMNSTAITTGAYVGSDYYTGNNSNTAKATCQTAIVGAFGSSHILTHKEYLANTITDNCETGGAWYDSTFELMNEVMVFGNEFFHNRVNGSRVPHSTTASNSQLPLFRLDHSCINSAAVNVKLRDVASGAAFSIIRNDGVCSYSNANNSGGIRPVFGICQIGD